MRFFSLAAGLASIALVATLATAQPPGGQQGGPAPSHKNLQVLPRDIPHERLIGIMRSFTVALGQRCTFCHMPSDYSSDANPHKNIARGMMRMTMHINGELLPPIFGAPAQGVQVTCFTCHRGSTTPATVPPEPAVGANAPQPAPEPPHDHHH
jgi:Photosynthetic reaction centre cytochrome C subunit